MNQNPKQQLLQRLQADPALLARAKRLMQAAPKQAASGTSTLWSDPVFHMTLSRAELTAMVAGQLDPTTLQTLTVSPDDKMTYFAYVDQILAAFFHRFNHNQLPAEVDQTLIGRIYRTGRVVDAAGKATPIYPWAVPAHLGRLLYDFILEHNLTNTLEIGLAYGLSALFIAQAHQKRGGGAHTAIDPGQSGFFSNHALHNLDQAGLRHRVQLIEEPDYQAMPQLLNQGRRFDMIFIDGLHLFDYVLLDFFYADLLLEPGGYLIFDDSTVPGVKRALDFVRTNRSYQALATSLPRLTIFKKTEVDQRFASDPSGFTEFTVDTAPVPVPAGGVTQDDATLAADFASGFTQVLQAGLITVKRPWTFDLSVAQSNTTWRFRLSATGAEVRPALNPTPPAPQSPTQKVGVPNPAGQEVGVPKVAVVGMSARHPNAPDIQSFWDRLLEAQPLFSLVPADRWDWQAYFGEPAPEAHLTRVNHGAFINDVYRFDAAFFKISNHEAAWMDPHQRLLLEETVRCMEDAGYHPDTLAGSRTAVYAALYNDSFSRCIQRQSGDALTLTGDYTFTANRMSYQFNLTGPSETVHTACSSASVALHRAAHALQAGECDAALVGAASMDFHVDSVISLDRMGLLSKYNHCRPFNHQPSGLMLGEGVAVVMLKRLDDARRDGDPIHGLIIGSAVNHAGNHSGSMTLTNAAAQAHLIQRTLDRAGLNPADLDVLEGHGSGGFGDEIELDALRRVFGKRPAQNPLILGSVKAYLGFNGAVGGLTQLIKVLLMMKHRTLAPTPGFERLPEGLGRGLIVPTQTQTWPQAFDDTGRPIPRRAGMNAYGLGGTGAFLILEEAPAEVASQPEPAGAHLITLSAATPGDLQSYASDLAVHLETERQLDRPARLQDVAHTLRVARRSMTHRTQFTAQSLPELIQHLKAFGAGNPLPTTPPTEPLAPMAQARRLSLPTPPFHGALFPKPDAAAQTSTPSQTHPQAVEADILDLIRDILFLEDAAHLDPDTTLFDLGLDSLTAMTLIQSLSRKFQTPLRETLIFDFPTVRAMAGHLAQLGAAKPRRIQTPQPSTDFRQHLAQLMKNHEQLVPLQIQGNGPILFCIHPMSGDVGLYTKLADAAQTRFRVVGIRAIGLNGRTTPYANLEAMADHYAQLVTAVDPTGPYHLFGSSLGGTIAYPMARALQSRGHTVANLFLAESPLIENEADAQLWRCTPRQNAVMCANFLMIIMLHMDPDFRQRKAEGKVDWSTLEMPEAVLKDIDQAAWFPTLVDHIRQRGVRQTRDILQDRLADMTAVHAANLDLFNAYRLKPLLRDDLHVVLFRTATADAADAKGYTPGYLLEIQRQKGSFAHYLAGWAKALPRLETRVVDGKSHFDLLNTTASIQAMTQTILDRLNQAVPKAAPQSAGTDIAVIGMACRFPGAPDIDSFWDLLQRGETAFTPYPADRGWNLPTDANPHGGFLSDITGFDPVFFQITPNEAAAMDPAERLFLMEAWHALEDAGVDPTALSGRNWGVFCGGGGDHALKLMAATGLQPQVTHSSFPGRVAYALNLTGPVATVDGGCASSALAVAQACDQLHLGRAQAALAGGVLIYTTPNLIQVSAQADLISQGPRGHAFGAAASGIMPAEGVGVVVLKPLYAALADGDRIHGVIEAWGYNHNGRTNGMTAPAAEGEARLFQDVYQRFGINPAHITMVEANATGTALGDAVEVQALNRVFANQPGRPVVLGSVENNIGHPFQASGVAHLLKVLLALNSPTIPPTPNVGPVNPALHLEDGPFQINHQPQAWPPGARRAALNSFGATGVNVHLVVRQAPPQPTPEAAPTLALICLSAKTPAALQDRCRRLAAYLDRPQPAPSLNRLAANLFLRRAHFKERLALVAQDIADLRRQLNQILAGKADDNVCTGAAGRTIGPALKALAQTTLDDLSQNHNQDNLLVLADLYAQGVPFQLDHLFTAADRLPLTLPGYPFENRVCDIDGSAPNPLVPQEPVKAAAKPNHGVLDLIAQATGFTTAELDADAAFTTLGFDSLLTLRLLAAVKERYGLNLQLRDLLQNDTPNRLAALISQAAQAEPIVSPPVAPTPIPTLDPGPWNDRLTHLLPQLHAVARTASPAVNPAPPARLQDQFSGLIQSGVALLRQGKILVFIAHRATSLNPLPPALSQAQLAVLSERLGDDVLIAPVTPQQHLMLYHSQTMAQPAWNVQQIFRLNTAAPDLDRLNRAFQSLAEDHDLLRTSFLALPEGFAQIITRLSMTRIGNAECQSLDHFITFIAKRRAARLDLSQPSLQLWVDTFDGVGYLGMVTHHALADAFTLPTLFNQLMDRHAALLQGRTPTSTPGPQYWMVALEAHAKPDAASKAARDHWRERFQSPVAPMRLPFSSHPSTQTSNEAVCIQTQITGEQAAQLAQCCRDHGTTHTQIFTTALTLIFHVGLNNPNAAFRFVRSGRNRAALMDLPGEFTQFQFLRPDLDLNTDGVTALDRLKTHLLEDLSHPVELNQQLALTGFRDLAQFHQDPHAVLIDSADMDAAGRPSAPAHGISILLESIQRQSDLGMVNDALAALCFQILKLNGDIHLITSYRRCLFNPAHMQHLVRLVQKTVVRLCQAPRQTLAALLEELAPDLKTLQEQVALTHQLTPQKQPLSEGQKGLWAQQKTEPESACYHVPICFQLDHAVEPVYLRQTLTHLLAAHPILSAGTEVGGGRVSLNLDPAKGVSLEPLDLSGLSPTDRLALLEDKVRQPFDLDAGPLIRAAYGHPAPGESLILLAVHHMVCDGRSTVLILQAFLNLYRDVRRGQTITVQPCLRFADYVRQEAALLQNAEGERRRHYWCDLLQEPLPNSTLPKDHTTHAFHGKTLTHHLSTQARDRIRAVARELGCFPSALFLAAFTHVLSHVTQSEDLLIGLPLLGRNQAGDDDVVGYFINMAPLRFEQCQTRTFRQRVADAQTQTAQALEHAYPLPALIQHLRTQGRTVGQLFEAVFNYQNFVHAAGLSNLAASFAPDFKVDFVQDLYQQGRYFEFEVMEQDTRFVLRIKYNAAAFDLATVQAFMDQVTQTLNDRLAQPDQDEAPILSYHQERMWFIDHFETDNVYPHNPTYHNLPLILDVDRVPDADALQTALDRLIQQHQILRTRVITQHAAGLPRIGADRTLPLQHIDPAANQTEALRRAVAYAAQPFVMDKDLPIRAALAPYGDQAALLVVTVHHMVADQRSLDLIAQTLGRDYTALVQGCRLEPVTPDQTYRYFAVLQKARVANAMDDHRAYWLNKLGGGLKALELPESRKRPAIHTYTPAQHDLTWSGDISADLHALAASVGAQPYTAALSLFLTLLHRYVGHDQIVVGLSHPCRDEAYAQAVGPFANLLVLPADLGGNPAFTQVLSAVQHDLNAAREYRNMPFDRLVTELNPAKDMSRTALFDVLFQFNEQPAPDTAFGPAAARRLDRNLGHGKYDINLALTLQADGLTGVLVYNADIFDHPVMVQISDHLHTLFRAVLANPDAGIGDHVLLSDAEVQHQLVTLNDTDAQWPRQTLHRLFEAQVDRTPDAVAVRHHDAVLTYRQLDDHANRLAHHLIAAGVQPRQLVGLFLERGLTMPVAFLGVLKAGAAYLPIDPANPDDRMRDTLTDAAVTHVLTTAGLRDRLPQQLSLTHDILQLDGPATRPNLPQDVDSPAYCIFTSGSTGKPKGALITHHNLARLFFNDRFQFQFAEDDVWSMCHSYCFDFSVWETYGALLRGGLLIIVDKAVVRDPAALLDMLVQHQVTVLNQTPSAFYPLAREIQSRAGRSNLALRYVIFGGEALSPALLADFHRQWPQVALINMYGITETTVHVTYKPITQTEIDRADSTIGAPIPTNTLYVMDQNLKLLPIGVPGELFVGGDGVCAGYLNRDDLTAQRFIPNPYNPKERLYRTGDLARRQPNGDLIYLGRLDNQIQLRGFRVELGEIENQLCRHPRVQEACAVVRGEGDAKQIVAWVVFKPQAGAAEPGPAELQRALGETLPEYMVPGIICRLDTMPLTTNGKIDRKQLSQRPLDLNRDSAATRPQLPLETQILAVWRQALGIQDIGIEDPFFNVGGNSILAVTVVEEINRFIDPKIKVAKMFQYQTVKALCRYIMERGGVSATPPSVPVQATLPPSMATPPAASLKPQPTAPPDHYKTSVAVIGMSCQVPGAQNHQQFWSNLLAGKESASFHSRDALRERGVPEELIQNPNFVPLCLELEDKEDFDHQFFDLSLEDAALMDPQFRHLLTHSQLACEDAGYRPRSLPETAVFMSAGNSLYQAQLQRDAAALNPGENAYASWVLSQGGAMPSMIAYKLGFTGAAVFVHSNCSSSLTGLHLAFQSLMAGDVKTALVGGAAILPHSKPGYLHQPGGNFSSDGRCRAFDAAADGMVAGEGVGVILLKNAAEAYADRDPIYGLIRAVGVNNDGADKVGYFAPSVSGQADVIEKTVRRSGVDPQNIVYMEAHGTGTPLGDALEFDALCEAFGRFTQKRRFCALGSLKSNVGHLDSAAGVMGCIKVLHTLHSQMLAPAINVVEPSPELDLEHSPFVLLDQPTPLRLDRRPCHAALSSFGVGGANAHAVFEAALPLPERLSVLGKSRLIPISGRNETQLLANARQLLDELLKEDGKPEPIDLLDLAFTLQVGREAQAERALIITDSISELCGALGRLIAGEPLPDGAYRGRVGDEVQVPDDLETWVREQPRAAARAWVSGADVPLHLSLIDEQPRRIHLPVTSLRDSAVKIPSPFPQDAPRQAAKPAVLHPLLQANTSNLTEQRYTSIFSGEEPWFQVQAEGEHKHLPQDVMLEMVRLAVRFAMTQTADDPGPHVTLTDTVWGAPLLAATQPRAVHVALLPQPEGLAYEIYSLPAQTNAGEAQPVVHGQGLVEVEEGRGALREIELMGVRG